MQAIPYFKDAPAEHKVEGVVFRLKGLSRQTGELHYTIATSALCVPAQGALPTHERDGHTARGQCRAPLARATDDGVAIPVRGLVGSFAIELSLDTAAAEMAQASRRIMAQERASASPMHMGR